LVYNTTHNYKITRIIHHAAQRGHGIFLPNSLSAVMDCMDAGASAIEIDILPLLDGSFALLHEADLVKSTNGQGNAIPTSRQDLQHLCLKKDGIISDEKLAFLDQVIPLLVASPSTRKLQLDLKPHTALTPALIQALLETFKPAFDRIQVSSVADWAIRALRKFSPDLQLGFDPLLYLDMPDEAPRPAGVPPFRIGAYSLLDDHPLSAYVWGEKKAYFLARAEALLAQAVPGCEWFIRHETLLAADDAGFDWVAFLHQNGCLVDTWTLDPPNFALAGRLIELGIDELTSNSPAVLANALNLPTCY